MKIFFENKQFQRHQPDSRCLLEKIFVKQIGSIFFVKMIDETDYIEPCSFY